MPHWKHPDELFKFDSSSIKTPCNWRHANTRLENRPSPDAVGGAIILPRLLIVTATTDSLGPGQILQTRFPKTFFLVRKVLHFDPNFSDDGFGRRGPVYICSIYYMLNPYLFLTLDQNSESLILVLASVHNNHFLWESNNLVLPLFLRWGGRKQHHLT